jgi:hypothetical protein
MPISPAIGEVLTPTADGAITVFNLAHTPTDTTKVAIYIGAGGVGGGVRVTNFSIVGKVVTFTTPPAAGDTPIADYPWDDGLPVGGDLTSLANVKLWLGITDTSSDAILSRLITTESASFLKEIDRNIIAQAYTETIDGSDPRIRRGTGFTPWVGGAYPGVGLGPVSRGWAIDLKNWPVIDVTSVVVDGQTIPQGSNPGQSTQVDGWMLVESYRIELLGATYAFTGGIQNVVITYDAGYASVPSDVDQALCELVGYRYRERDRIGQRSKSLDGGGSVSYLIDVFPPSVKAVIDSYRRVNI